MRQFYAEEQLWIVWNERCFCLYASTPLAVVRSIMWNCRKLDVQRTATAIGRRNFAVSGPETWNSLPAELRLSTLSTATFTRRLKAHLFVSTEWHVPAARLILLKAALLINIIIIIITAWRSRQESTAVLHVQIHTDADLKAFADNIRRRCKLRQHQMCIERDIP